MKYFLGNVVIAMATHCLESLEYSEVVARELRNEERLIEYMY